MGTAILTAIIITLAVALGGIAYAISIVRKGKSKKPSPPPATPAATPAPARTPARFRWLNIIWILIGVAIIFVIATAIWRSGSASLNWLDWRAALTVLVISFLVAAVLSRMSQLPDNNKGVRHSLELASWSTIGVGLLAAAVWALSFLWLPTPAVAAGREPIWGTAEAQAAAKPVEEDPEVITKIIKAPWGSWSSWHTLPPRCNFEVVPDARVLCQTASGKQYELGPDAVGQSRESSYPAPTLIHEAPLGRKDATRSYTSLVPGREVVIKIRLRRQ